MQLASDSDTDPILLDQIGRVFLDRPAVIEKIVENPSTGEETLILVEGVDRFHPWVEARRKRTLQSPSQDDEKDKAQSLYNQVQQMTVSQKVQLALKGGGAARALLIKDPNKQVGSSVLKNPKIAEREVEIIAQSKNVSEEVLRLISRNKNWIRNYNIVLSLVNNPRTPIGVTLGFVKILKTKDLGFLEKNRNVPEGLRTTAAKMLHHRQQRG